MTTTRQFYCVITFFQPVLFLVWIVTTQALVAQEKSLRQLDLDLIFDSKEFAEDPVPQIRWLDHVSGYTILDTPKKVSVSPVAGRSDSDETKPESGGAANSSNDATRKPRGKDIVRVDPISGESVILVRAEELIPEGTKRPLSISNYIWSNDGRKLLIFSNTRKVWRSHTRGDYWCFDIQDRSLRKLGGDADEATLMFAKFSPDANRVGFVRENNIYVEDLRSGKITPVTTDGNDDLIRGTFDWVYEEELGLRDGFRWSPDGGSIAFWQLDTTGVQRYHLIDNTSELYPRIKSFKYPKVGQTNAACTIAIFDLDRRETIECQIPGDPRQHYLANMQWSEDSGGLYVQQLNRLQNTNRLFLVNRASGDSSEVYVDHDDAWLDMHGELIWIDGGTRFLWTTERNGWRQLLSVSLDGTHTIDVTPATFDVISLVKVDISGGSVYYLASPDDPTRAYLYRSTLDGTLFERVTPSDQRGMHSYDVSPDAKWAIHTWSTFTSPPVIELISLPDHQRHRLFTDNRKLREKLSEFEMAESYFFRVETDLADPFDAWCIKPRRLEPDRKYPLLIYVYGEPAGQTVLDRWRGRSFLWYTMLAQRGYVVMSIDNRGTPAPRGREWRKSVYRQVGVLAPQDQAAAVSTLLEKHDYLDPGRVGIWGWSGGGQMSLNAIFKYPMVYKMAMAVAFVSDQRLYDTIYQERYMGLPDDNPDGFKNGSPIHFAEQLEGELLIVHGTADDNVHYQNFERLVDELIRLDKRFSMMVYPNRTHSISEGSNTTRHVYRTLTHFIYDNL